MKKILLVLLGTPALVSLAYTERGYFAIGSEYIIIPCILLYIAYRKDKKND